MFPQDSAMQMVKIQIPDRGDRAKTLGKLVGVCRIICLRDNVFIIPEPALQELGQLGVSYHELGRGGMDYAQKALRDSLTNQVQ